MDDFMLGAVWALACVCVGFVIGAVVTLWLTRDRGDEDFARRVDGGGDEPDVPWGGDPLVHIEFDGDESGSGALPPHRVHGADTATEYPMPRRSVK